MPHVFYKRSRHWPLYPVFIVCQKPCLLQADRPMKGNVYRLQRKNIIDKLLILCGSAGEMFSRRDAEIAEIKKIEKSFYFIPFQ